MIVLLLVFIVYFIILAFHEKARNKDKIGLTDVKIWFVKTNYSTLWHFLSATKDVFIISALILYCYFSTLVLDKSTISLYFNDVTFGDKVKMILLNDMTLLLMTAMFYRLVIFQTILGIGTTSKIDKFKSFARFCIYILGIYANFVLLYNYLKFG